MELKEILDELYCLDTMLIHKGYKLPVCYVSVDKEKLLCFIKTNYTTETPLIRMVEAETWAALFDKARSLISELPDGDLHLKQEAVRLFGNAIDALRASGIGADFVDPLSDSFRALSENLLEYSGSGT